MVGDFRIESGLASARAAFRDRSATLLAGGSYTAEAREPDRRNRLLEQLKIARRLRATIESAVDEAAALMKVDDDDDDDEEEEGKEGDEAGDLKDKGIILTEPPEEEEEEEEEKSSPRTVLDRLRPHVCELVSLTEAIRGGYSLDSYRNQLFEQRGIATTSSSSSRDTSRRRSEEVEAARTTIRQHLEDMAKEHDPSLKPAETVSSSTPTPPPSSLPPPPPPSSPHQTQVDGRKTPKRRTGKTSAKLGQSSPAALSPLPNDDDGSGGKDTSQWDVGETTSVTTAASKKEGSDEDGDYIPAEEIVVVSPKKKTKGVKKSKVGRKQGAGGKKRGAGVSFEKEKKKPKKRKVDATSERDNVGSASKSQTETSSADSDKFSRAETEATKPPPKGEVADSSSLVSNSPPPADATDPPPPASKKPPTSPTPSTEQQSPAPPRRKINNQVRKCHDCKVSGTRYRRCHFWFMNGTKCRKTYCVECLVSKYKMKEGSFETIISDEEWHCPACLGTCVCKVCVKQRERVGIRAAAMERRASRYIY